MQTEGGQLCFLISHVALHPEPSPDDITQGVTFGHLCHALYNRVGKTCVVYKTPKGPYRLLKHQKGPYGFLKHQKGPYRLLKHQKRTIETLRTPKRTIVSHKPNIKIVLWYSVLSVALVKFIYFFCDDSKKKEKYIDILEPHMLPS